MKKAVILDRDGVINEMVYRKEQDFVDSPTSLKQFSIIKGVPKALKIIKNLGFLIIIISNQPGIAKGYYSKKTFELIRKKMHNELGKRSKMIDGEYYCLHHPHAKLLQYRKNCTCRKPGIKLIKNCSKIHNLNLKKSYLIGDGLNDIIAAKKAGCKSIFIGNLNSTVSHLFKTHNLYPNYVAHDLLEAALYLRDDKLT